MAGEEAQGTVVEEAPESVALPETHGQLIIIGGAEDKEGECKILREFVRRAGGFRLELP